MVFAKTNKDHELDKSKEGEKDLDGLCTNNVPISDDLKRVKEKITKKDKTGERKKQSRHNEQRKRKRYRRSPH